MQESALDVTVPFESASELQEAHTSLLEALDRQIGPDASADNAAAALAQLEMQIRQFLERGAATGIYLNEITDRTSCQVLIDYWVSSLSHAGLEVTGIRLARFDELKLPDLKNKPCPYVGLDAFRNQDFFFGREADTQQLLKQIRETPLVVVLGASGSGKSSLVMGGVLPALTEPEASSQMVVIPPFVPGNAVLDGLATAVMQIRPSGGEHTREVEQLRQTPSHLSLMLGGADAPSTLITIDQFEEVFTLTPSTDREALVANLAQLLEAGRGHRVILTVREEFRSRIVELLALSAYLDKAWYSMRPMNYEELKTAVECPAAEVNLQFQSGIVDDLVKTVLGQPAALPLLQFTLRSLWGKRDRNRITKEVYQQVGDPLNALAKSADNFHDHLAPQTKDEVKRVLLELVRVDELLEAYRQPVLQSRLVQPGKANTEEVIALLDENDYVRITPNADGTDAVIEVKHESLIRNWPRFVAWIDDKRMQRRQRLILTQAARQWVQNGKHREDLLTGWQLREATEDPASLDDDEREFVAASADAAERKQREEETAQFKIRFRRIIILTLSIVLIIVGGVAYYYNLAREQAENAQRRAEQSQKRVETAQQRADELLKFLLGEQFLGKIRDVGSSSMLEEIGRKIQEYISNGGPTSALGLGLALRNAGDIERMQGNTEKSLHLFEKALGAIEGSAERTQSPESDRETARTYDRLAEVLAAQGRVTQALDHHQRAVQTWGRVVDSKVRVEVGDCIGFADSQLGVAEVEHAMGKTAEASKHLTEALTQITSVPFNHCASTSKAIATYPTAEALVVLSRGLMFQAIISNQLEDYEGALRLAIEAKQLSPASISAKKQEATAKAWLANTKITATPAAALKDYREVLAEFDLFRRQDPTNNVWKRERAAVQLLIAEATVECYTKKLRNCQSKTTLEDAAVTNLQAFSTLSGLVRDDPNSMALQQDLGWAWRGRAKIFAARHEHQARLNALQKAEQFYAASILDNSDAEGILLLGDIFLDQSRALAALEKVAEAKAVLAKSVERYEAYGQKIGTPEKNLSILSRWIEARTEENKILRKAGDGIGATRAEQERKRLQKVYNDLDSKVFDINNKKADELYNSHTASQKKGAELFEKHDYAGALHEFKTAESAMRKYLDVKPAHYIGYDYQRYIYDWIRLTQEKLGHVKEVPETIRIMVEMARIAFLLSPQNVASSLNEKLRLAQQGRGIALYYSPDFKDHADETLAAVQEEIVSATESLRIDPNNAIGLKNLGNAYYGQSLVSQDAQKAGWEEAVRIGIVYLQRAAAIDDKNPQYLKELGGMLKHLADTLDASGITDKASVEHSRALAAYEKAARLSQDDKEIKDAIEDLKARGAQ